jgi:hypothetical protein
MMSIRVSGLLAVVLGTATQIFGACGDDPSNLMRFSNCGLDSDISGWTLVAGDLLVHHPTEGYSELGAAYAEPTYYQQLNRSEFRVDGPCVTVQNFTEYDFGAFMKAFGQMMCSVSLFEYTDASCGSWVAGCGGPSHSSSGSWVLVDNQCTTGSTTQSGRLHVYCQDESSFQAVLDDAFIMLAPFFADGFEGGTTSAWSVTVP